MIELDPDFEDKEEYSSSNGDFWNAFLIYFLTLMLVISIIKYFSN